jgi:hypothetical protein
MGAQVGVCGNLMEWIGANPTFNKITVLNTGRNLKQWHNFEDFVGANAVSPGIWYKAVAGGGDNFPWVGTSLRPGIWWFTAANVNDASALRSGGAASEGFIFSNGVYTIESDVYLAALSTAAQEYTFQLGFGDTMGADQVDGAYFRYDRTVSVNWLACTANNSARTATDTGIAVGAAAWIRLKIVINADATAVAFYINGVLVATNVLNIPTARTLGAVIALLKTVGAGAVQAWSDWIWLHYDLTVSR